MTEFGNWSALELVVATFFLLWLGASALNQLPGELCRWLKRHDVIAAIPAWTFFAPNPGKSDFFLLYRDRSPEGYASPWRVVHVDGKAGMISAVWNPIKRRNKALTDHASELLYLAARYRRQSLVVTLPYVVLLNPVTAQRREMSAEATQLAIFQLFGFHSRWPA